MENMEPLDLKKNIQLPNVKDVVDVDVEVPKELTAMLDEAEGKQL